MGKPSKLGVSEPLGFSPHVGKDDFMGKGAKLRSSEPPQEPGQFHGIPHPFIWKISPVEGVLKREISLHDKSHMEEGKSFPVAFPWARSDSKRGFSTLVPKALAPCTRIIVKKSSVQFWILPHVRG